MTLSKSFFLLAAAFPAMATLLIAIAVAIAIAHSAPDGSTCGCDRGRAGWTHSGPGGKTGPRRRSHPALRHVCDHCGEHGRLSAFGRSQMTSGQPSSPRSSRNLFGGRALELCHSYSR
jgi:hypothetical protein